MVMEGRQKAVVEGVDAKVGMAMGSRPLSGTCSEQLPDCRPQQEARNQLPSDVSI